MDFIKYRFIYYPVLFVAGIFIFDKIFLLPEVRDNFIQPGGMMYYRQRHKQLHALDEFFETPRSQKKVAAVLGDSRSFALGNVAAWYIEKKEWYLFNFAGPQAVPAYHYYIAKKILSKHKRPEYLIIGLSPDGFNKNSPYFANPVMNYGMDDHFIQDHQDLILKRDYESYSSTRRYALVGMNFSLKVLQKRIMGSAGIKTTDSSEELPVHMFPILTDFIEKSYAGSKKNKTEFLRAFINSPLESLDQYTLTGSPRVNMLDLADGANYSWFGTMGHKKLKSETEKLVELYLKGYEVSDVQLNFFRETVRLAREAGVRVIVFWPRANPYLIDVYQKDRRIYELWSEIVKITESEGGRAIDLNTHPDTKCSSFYDASHLSIVCYPSIAKTLLNELESMK